MSISPVSRMRLPRRGRRGNARRRGRRCRSPSYWGRLLCARKSAGKKKRRAGKRLAGSRALAATATTTQTRTAINIELLFRTALSRARSMSACVSTRETRADSHEIDFETPHASSGGARHRRRRPALLRGRGGCGLGGFRFRVRARSLGVLFLVICLALIGEHVPVVPRVREHAVPQRLRLLRALLHEVTVRLLGFVHAILPCHERGLAAASLHELAETALLLLLLLLFPVGRIGRLRAVPGLRGRILGIRLRLPRRVRGGFPRHRRSPARA
mmetsp:Transcript_206/g.799  ORF Transcript_206/g.799 Transcript_206/m.799 type:complete len:272 (+) Transcript_206:938-1753(+)